MFTPRGDVIMTCEPYAHVLSRKERGKRCDSCFQTPEKLQRCTLCQLTRYCDRNCQKKDWFLHKEECACLTQVKPKIPTDSVRLLLRVVIRNKKEDQKKCIEGDPGFRTFFDFQSHKKEIEADKERSSSFVQICITLKELTYKILELPSPSELFEIYGKMMINTFTICDGEMNEVGTGIYISASMLDHRCIPNAVVTFNGTVLNVRALENMSNYSVQNVFISYIDQLATSSERNKKFREQYYFECSCNRCKDKELDGLMLSINCPQLNCEGLVYTNTDGSKASPCSLCNTDISLQKMKKVRELGDHFTEKLKQIDEMKKHSDCAEKILSLCEECLKEQEEVFSKYNIHRVRILDKAFDACIDLEEWEKAVTYGQSTIEPYERLYPPYSVNVGIQLLKVGKLLLYLQRLEEAMKTLQQAESIIHITHGKSHDMYQTVSELLEQCMEELRTQLEQPLTKKK